MRTCSRLSLTHCIFSKIINGRYHKPPFRRQHLRGKFLILNSLFHLKVCWCCIWSLFRSFDNFHFFLLSRILVTTSYLLGQKNILLIYNRRLWERRILRQEAVKTYIRHIKAIYKSYKALDIDRFQLLSWSIPSDVSNFFHFSYKQWNTSETQFSMVELTKSVGFYS